MVAKKLLLLDGMMALRFNAVAVALEDIRALHGMSQLLEGEPSAMAFLLDGDARSAALYLIKSAVRHHAFSEAQLQELLPILNDMKTPQEHLWLTIEGERGQLLTVLDEFSKKQGAARYLLGSPRARIVALDMLDHLQAITYEDLGASTKAIDSVSNESQRYLSSVRMPTSADHTAPLKLSSTLALAHSIVRRQLQIRLTRLAIGIELYRLRHKRWPEQLTDVTEFGIDPQQNMPLGGKTVRLSLERRQGIGRAVGI